MVKLTTYLCNVLLLAKLSSDKKGATVTTKFKSYNDLKKIDRPFLLVVKCPPTEYFLKNYERVRLIDPIANDIQFDILIDPKFVTDLRDIAWMWTPKVGFQYSCFFDKNKSFEANIKEMEYFDGGAHLHPHEINFI